MGTYREHLPPPQFLDSVECIWTSQGLGESVSHRVLPDGCLDFVVMDEGNGFRGYLVGAMSTFQDVPNPTNPRVCGVRFLPGQAQRHLGMPLGKMVDTRVELEDLFGNASSHFVEAGAAQDIRELWSQLESLTGTPTAPSPIQQAAHWAARAYLGPQTRPVSLMEIAATIWMSPRQFRRRFAEEVGLSPKQYLRSLRLRAAMAGLRSNPPQRLIDIALRCGFFDQAHFANEIRELTGRAPGEWRQNAGVFAKDAAA